MWEKHDLGRMLGFRSRCIKIYIFMYVNYIRIKEVLTSIVQNGKQTDQKNERRKKSVV